MTPTWASWLRDEALKLYRDLEAAIAGKPAPKGDRECFHDRVHLTSGGVVKVW